MYQNTLVVHEAIESFLGNYTCSVTNKFGNSSSKLTVRGKTIFKYIDVQTTTTLLFQYLTLRSDGSCIMPLKFDILTLDVTIGMVP